MYEGGVRVPGFIYGPKNFFPNSFDYNGLFHISDFYPTILQIIGKQDILSNKPHSTMDGVGQFLALNGSTNAVQRTNVHIHRSVEILFLTNQYLNGFEYIHLSLFEVNDKISKSFQGHCL